MTSKTPIAPAEIVKKALAKTDVMTHCRSKRAAFTSKRSSSLSRQLLKRKHCNSRCPIFPCIFYPLALQNDNQCALKIMSKSDAHHIVKIIVGGKSGFESEAKNVLSLLYHRIDKNSPESIKEYIDTLIKVGKFIYGEQIHAKIESSITGLTVNNALTVIQEHEDEKKNGAIEETVIDADFSTD